MALEDLIGRMTLEQKCALLSGGAAFATRAYPALGIPAMDFSDGPHGMRHQGENANHLGIGGSLPATCFPTAATVANSWDPALGEELGAALGQEAATQGVGVVLGPGLNIKRSPLCGRNFEYFSEDPLLAGKMAAGYVRGIQSAGVAACPKHFALNNQETRRQASDSVVDERTMREIYLAGFETVVRESDPKCLMTSYNLINGTYTNEDAHLLQDILRREWGFSGAVVTDWGGSNDHVAGVAAGSDFEMPGPVPAAVRELIEAVKQGRITEAQVDAAVEDALGLILSTSPAVEAARGTQFDVAAHHQLARKIAAQGIVLLKNERDTAGRALLPLVAGTHVALVGDFAETPRYQGAGSSLVNCTKIDTMLDVVQGSELEFVGYERGFDRSGKADPALAQAAASLAKRADVVIACLGLDESVESEGMDRLNMRLAQNQIDMLSQVAAANSNVVVLLSCGSQVETGWVADARAVLYLCLGGQAGAAAALDVLTGAVNPSGKLAETWVRRIEDTPTYGNYPSVEFCAEYREGIYVGYRYHQTAGVPVAFPFGFGLSYTSFAYSNIEARGAAVSFTLTNTGSVAGAEVCQLYVAKPEHEVFRPEQELKGFAKVYLEPGESARVSIGFSERSFSYWNVATGGWEIEGGVYELRVGASCEDIRLTAHVRVEGTGAANPYAGKSLPAYEMGAVQRVDDAQFAELLGRAIPQVEIAVDRNICFRDLNRGRSLIFWLVWLVVGQAVKAQARARRSKLNALFIWNMPLRALAKNAGAVFSMGMVDALVLLVRGWGWVGLAAGIVLKLFTRCGICVVLLVWLLVAVAPVLAQLAVAFVKNGQLAARLKAQDQA